jgi:6-phosphogluconolactonase
MAVSMQEFVGRWYLLRTVIRDILHIYDTPEALAEGFTRFFNTHAAAGKKQAAVALSGGSTPKAVFDYWSLCGKDALSWDNILFFWGDERCVPPDDAMSNYGMAKKCLFDNVPAPPQHVFRIKGENNPDCEALRYADILARKLEQVNNLPSFDMVMLGLGGDGHTASIFPSRIDLWDSPACCIVTESPESSLKRISITGKMINNARHVAFLVTGENKAGIVRDIIRDREKYTNVYPAARVQPCSQEIRWFLDRASAKKLQA